jgi:hypothetical protein
MRFKQPTAFLIKGLEPGQCSLKLGGVGQSQRAIDRGNQLPAACQQVGPFCPKPVVKAWRVDKLIDGVQDTANAGAGEVACNRKTARAVPSKPTEPCFVGFVGRAWAGFSIISSLGCQSSHLLRIICHFLSLG